MIKKLFIGLKTLLIIVLISIFYFSWIPDPIFKHLDFIPKYLANWADDYGNLRTGVPFVILGFLLGIIKDKSIYYYFSLFFGLVLLCEIGQLFTTRRRFDLMDIFWGVMGGVLGVLLASLFKKIFLKRIENK